MAFNAKPVLPSGDGDELGRGLQTEEGVDLFRRILARPDLAQVIVSPVPVDQEIERVNRYLPDVIAEKPARPAARTSAHPRPNLPVAYAAPRNETEKELVNLWQGLLGIEPIGIQDNFFDLGGHSLLATQTVARIRDLFDVNLSLRDIFKAPTIEALAMTLLQSKVSSTDDSDLLSLLEELEK